jgi:hypothetical protein
MFVVFALDGCQEFTVLPIPVLLTSCTATYWILQLILLSIYVLFLHLDLHCHYWILQLILLSIYVLFLHLDLLPPSQTNVCTVVVAGTNDNVVDAAWLVC